MNNAEEHKNKLISPVLTNVDMRPMAVLEQYWRDLGHGTRLPARSDIDPAKIGTALPHAFILERVAPGIGRIRVSGQMINKSLGMDARGMPLSAFFNAPCRDQLAIWLEQVWGTSCLAQLPLMQKRTLGAARPAGQMLLLPLLDEQGNVTRALGCITTDVQVAKAPRRFSLGPVGECRFEAAGPKPFTPHIIEGGGTGRTLGQAKPTLRVIRGLNA